MPILSHTAEYALRAATYLAQQPPGTPVDVGLLAARLVVPRNYLSKILSRLGRSGLLESSRGKRGGFSLAGDPRQITIYDVVEPFERLGEERRCLLGQASCGGSNPCPAHQGWRAVNDRMIRFFRGTSLADLARGTTRWPGARRSSRQPAGRPNAGSGRRGGPARYSAA